jgi:hypothetical protein
MRDNHDTTTRAQAQPIFSAACGCLPAGHLINTTGIQGKLVGMEPMNLDSYIYIDCSGCLPGSLQNRHNFLHNIQSQSTNSQYCITYLTTKCNNEFNNK